MKNRSKLPAAVLLLIVLAAGWRFLGVGSSPSPAQATMQKLPTTAEVSPTPLPTSAVSSSADIIKTLEADPALTAEEKAFALKNPGDFDKYVRFAQARFETNSTTINVYGKIIDQYGQPVADAVVKGGTLLVVSPISSGGEEFVTRTDANGQFSFTGLHGARFGFGVEKSGYQYDPRKYLGWWESYKPDPNNPAVFTIWKLSGAEPMVHTQLDSRVPYDGQSATFDLLSGKKVINGELRVTLTRTPLQVKRGVDRFDWNVRIEVQGEGLVEATDPYKNLAPQSGFRPALVFEQTKDNPKWTESLTKTFYVHTSKGQYGRVLVDLTMNSDRADTGISIETWLNPSGSRNLEFDEAKQVKP